MPAWYQFQPLSTNGAPQKVAQFENPGCAHHQHKVNNLQKWTDLSRGCSRSAAPADTLSENKLENHCRAAALFDKLSENKIIPAKSNSKAKKMSKICMKMFSKRQFGSQREVDAHQLQVSYSSCHWNQFPYTKYCSKFESKGKQMCKNGLVDLKAEIKAGQAFHYFFSNETCQL